MNKIEKNEILAWTRDNLDFTNPEGFYRNLKEYLNAQDRECERCKHLENKCREWNDRFTKKANELVELQVKITFGANTEQRK